MHVYCPHCDQYTTLDCIDDDGRISFGDGIITKSEKSSVVGTTQYCPSCNRQFILAAVAEDLIKIAACKI